MKKLLITALLAPMAALAQTYPSPTFNSITLQNPLTAANGGTGASSSTGTGSVVLSNSPTLTTPNLGTPSIVTLTNGTGLPISTGVSGLGIGVAGGLANAVTGSGSPVLATSPSIASPTVTGSFTATGLVTLADLATQSANTIIANASGSTGSPTAISAPSCSTSSSALGWTSGTGLSCNSSINAATLGGATFAAPGAIGSTTPGAAAFTNLTASGTVSGAGFTSLLAPYLTSATAASNYAPIVSPSLTGTPTAPTAATGTNTTQLATTAFVQTTASNPASPVSIGTSLNPNITAPISTTATTTSGSMTITVTSATGITTGMGVYGTFVGACSQAIGAFVNAYVTSISGTTITMSCPATATNSSPVSVQFGQTRFGPSSTILANNVGAYYAKIGSAAQGNSAAWLDQVSAGQDYQATSALQVIVPPGGGYGITTAARSSDATGGAAAFPFQSILYLDSWPNTNYASENVYLQDNLAAATDGHSQPHIQMEQSINSLWTTRGEDPYQTNQIGQTILHRYDCGTGQLASPFPNNCTSAIDIVNNGAKLENGIVIGNNALDTSNGFGNALSMPLNTGLIWFSAANSYSATVGSKNAGMLDINIPTSGSGIRLNGSLLLSGQAPSISSGFGSGASIVASNGTAAFRISVGTSPGTGGTLAMPTAANGWVCDGYDLSQINSSAYYFRQTGFTTTSVTMNMYNTSGTTANLVAGDLIIMKCSAF